MSAICTDKNNSSPTREPQESFKDTVSSARRMEWLDKTDGRWASPRYYLGLDEN